MREGTGLSLGLLMLLVGAIVVFGSWAQDTKEKTAVVLDQMTSDLVRFADELEQQDTDDDDLLLNTTNPYQDMTNQYMMLRGTFRW